ncbi:MAG: nitroreductase family protein, partial [Spirochaetes bacterium]|nr:nitroreductase family protein [Spirochaetota bacterium]
MSFLDLVKKRYSCRDYMKKDIPDDILGEILEAARLAPTAKN